MTAVSDRYAENMELKEIALEILHPHLVALEDYSLLFGQALKNLSALQGFSCVCPSNGFANLSSKVEESDVSNSPDQMLWICFWVGVILGIFAPCCSFWFLYKRLSSKVISS